MTGSCYLMESNAFGRILLECGMHQGKRTSKHATEEEFPFDPHSIGAVILSHAHLDHSGRLPKLVHEGFNGPIFCTEATAELLDIMLQDSFDIYCRDLEHLNKRRMRKGQKVIEPQYSMGDVIKTLELCRPQPYQESASLSEHCDLTFYDAGHILGSAMVELKFKERGETKILVFSGDLGNSDTVLMNDPTPLTQADVVLMEGTYGNRNHRSIEETVAEFGEILSQTYARGGNVLIPAFAVGRTQELLFYLGKMHADGELGDWRVFLDSPMAIAVTKVYDRWLDTMDCEGIKNLDSGQQTLLRGFIPRLQLSVSKEDSMAINEVKSGAIIIAGSGMCTGGRIRHHLKHRIWNESNALVFVGHQAKGTLGRTLVDKAKYVKLFGNDYAVRARIATLGGYSAHAGQDALVEWASRFEGPPRILLIHGEPEALEGLSQRLWDEKSIRTEIPVYQQSISF